MTDETHFINTFLAKYPQYSQIQFHTLYMLYNILHKKQENPFNNPNHVFHTYLLYPSVKPINAYTWGDIQDAVDLYSVLHNKQLMDDLLKEGPMKGNWVRDYIHEREYVPVSTGFLTSTGFLSTTIPTKDPIHTKDHTKKQGPCPWVLQRGGTGTCWDHEYIDPIIEEQLYQNTYLRDVAATKSPRDMKEIAALEHMRIYLEEKRVQKPHKCPWIHPDHPSWNPVWSTTHRWKTYEERMCLWKQFTDQIPNPNPNSTTNTKTSPIDCGTEIHSFRAEKSEDYRAICDGSKKDIQTSIQKVLEWRKPPIFSDVPRYPPTPPGVQAAVTKHSFIRVV